MDASPSGPAGTLLYCLDFGLRVLGRRHCPGSLFRSIMLNRRIDSLPRATLQISARSSAPNAAIRAFAVHSNFLSTTIVPLTSLLTEPRAHQRAVPLTPETGAA